MEYLLGILVAALVSLLPGGEIVRDSGPLSVYHPGDGWNAGELACGGRLTHAQVHIAYRRWWKVGCGRKVLVCARDTARCALATVQDAGPFGIYTGALKNAYQDGRWKVFTGPGRPPTGWRYRAVVDLSIGLWRKLGEPSGLSNVQLTFLPRGAAADAIFRLAAQWQRLVYRSHRLAPSVL
jgi:hypothetical protein